MSLQIKTASGHRELSAAEVKSIFRGHPPPVVVAMMEHFAASDHVVAAEHAERYLANQLVKICAVVWKAATEPAPPGLPGYRFVAPPAGAATRSPRRIGNLGVVTCFSSYAACEPAQLEVIASLGSKALARLEAGGFAASVPEPGSPEPPRPARDRQPRERRRRGHPHRLRGAARRRHQRRRRGGDGVDRGRDPRDPGRLGS